MYNGFAFDQSNNVVLISDYDAMDTSIFGDFYCEFRLRLLAPTGNEAADDLAFDAMVENLEATLRVPRQRLLVTMGAGVVRDWNFNLAARTAFLIQPELKLIEENRRNFKYGFRVRCQYPFDLPTNAFRRESLTTAVDTLRANRTCTITATWTSSQGATSQANFVAGADAFCTAFLPSNGQDQYGNAGHWVRADENPAFNDENSVLSVTRTFWEVFAGRRDSSPEVVTDINGNRVFRAPTTWVATANGNALQNYVDGGDAFYRGVLANVGNLANGEWIYVDEDYSYNDQNGVLVVTRRYEETINGLREYVVNTTTMANQLRQVVISGTYYESPKNGSTARQSYLANVSTLVKNALGGLAPAFTRFEQVSVPKVERYDTTGRRYFFTLTFTELAYPQGPGGTDDPNITFTTLDIQVQTPREPETFTQQIQPSRLRRARARFAATIDYTKSQDPAVLWTAGIRAFVVNAIATKLGSPLLVDVVDEVVAVGLHNNTIIGTLDLVVTQTNVLRLAIRQTLVQVPGLDPQARADGFQFSDFPYYDVADKILIRELECEYVPVNGQSPPAFLATGDEVPIFQGFIDTGINAQDSVDKQNAGGPYDLSVLAPNNWIIDRRAPKPFAQVDIATTRGSGFNTILHLQVETWRWIKFLEPGTAIPSEQ